MAYQWSRSEAHFVGIHDTSCWGVSAAREPQGLLRIPCQQRNGALCCICSFNYLNSDGQEFHHINAVPRDLYQAQTLSSSKWYVHHLSVQCTSDIHVAMIPWWWDGSYIVTHASINGYNHLVVFLKLLLWQKPSSIMYKLFIPAALQSQLYNLGYIPSRTDNTSTLAGGQSMDLRQKS